MKEAKNATANRFVSMPFFPPAALCAILCRKMEMRERDDFECAPRCSAHFQRKKDFKFRVSGKSADFPETHFHGKGLGR